MLLDRTHHKWVAATAAAFLVAVVIYLPYSKHAVQGPRGGSALGLAYGIIGSALMVFAGLLSARKQVPVWRVGSAQTWMRGHLWLGLLSFPLILLHSGLRFGGPLTAALMWLFIVVVFSGVAGAVLQHYLPRMMMRDVPLETIYEQIPQVREQLREEAERLVAAAVGAPAPASLAAHTRSPAVTAVTAPVEVAEESAQRLYDFFYREVHPFLVNPKMYADALADAQQAEAIFKNARVRLPLAFAPVLDDLESICEEARQLTRQERLHHILHGWLLVHVPLSFALLLLGAVHAVMALRY